MAFPVEVQKCSYNQQVFLQHPLFTTLDKDTTPLSLSFASSWMQAKEYHDHIMILIRNNTILTKNIINFFKTVFSHNSLPRWHCLGSLNSLYVPI